MQWWECSGSKGQNKKSWRHQKKREPTKRLVWCDGTNLTNRTTFQLS